jgi:ATP-binding cassette subfamily B protein
MALIELSRADDLQAESSAAAAVSLLGSLVIVARHHSIQLSVPQLIHDHLLEPGQPSVPRLLAIAEASGLRAISTRLAFSDLPKLGTALPVIVVLRNGNAMVLREVIDAPELPRVVLQDPNAHEDAPLVLDEERFAATWAGQVLLVKRDYRPRDEDQPFGVRMVVGLLLRDKRVARDVAISAFMMSILGLGPLLFWRLLVDDVLYYGSMDTFAFVCVMILLFITFETLFGYLRRFLILNATKRVEVVLSKYIFDKVIQLPIDYFERNPVGEITRDMNEIHKIRNFMAGSLFGVVIDACMLVVYLPIMFYFSVILTFYILGFATLICIWIVIRMPDLRLKTAAVMKVEGEKNAFIVETLYGMRTVKALALVSRRRHDWDVKVANAARLRFEEGRSANLIYTVVTPLDRLMISGMIALAVLLAVTNHDTVLVGALFAFMMLSQRVSSPLVQLAQMAVQYDEVRLAVGVISRLVNQPSEEGRGKGGIRTPIIGRVEFGGVRFRYLGTNSPALDNVTFTIPEGSVFGIMGRSGSGKTTVTRLLQLFHGNYEGLIKVDGTDLRQYDVDHLRGNFGVVMQENFLFSGSIRDTICSGKPDASFDEVVMAARLAGAEEFIERLPRGYDTYIYEGSPNLSGGQRQRLAIARALITNPRILILDEATSALDAESEAIVNANLMRIAEGRTMIVVSHRLSSLVSADAILVLERGKVYDVGTHAELIERCDIYSNLWHQQNSHLLPRPTHEVISLRPANSA